MVENSEVSNVVHASILAADIAPLSDNDNPKFIKCCSCDMFALLSYTDYMQLIDNQSVLKCTNCQQNMCLLAQVNDLNHTIADLNKRVSSLRVATQV